MPRRDELYEAYWLVPAPRLRGYDSGEPASASRRMTDPTRPATTSERVQAHLEKHPAGFGRVEVHHASHAPEWIDPRDMPTAVLITRRDRFGFLYERVVGMDDYVSQADAAKIVNVPVMTIHRWVRDGVLPAKRRNRASIIRLADLRKLAIDKKRKVRLGVHLVALRGADPK